MARRSPAKGKKASPGVASDQIEKAWGNGKLPRAILIVGPEAALREEALAGIRKAAFKDGDGGMNWIILHGPLKARGESDPLEPATVLDELFTVSMFAESDEPKVVVVRKAGILLNEARAKEAFERSLPKIPDTAVLVFEVAEAGRLKSTRLYKALAKAGSVVACDALTNPWGPDGPDSPLAAALAKKGRALGLNINAAAAMALIERSGQNLGVLEEELGKLSLALGGTAEKVVAVSAADIERVCASTRLADPFEFADALAERNTKKSLEVLGAIFGHGLGDHKKPGRVVTNETSIAMRLLGVVTWKITQLQDLRAAIDNGMREFDAFKQVKLFGARQNDARRALNRHTAASLRKAVEALLKANLSMRTGSTPQEALDRLVWETCTDYQAP